MNRKRMLEKKILSEKARLEAQGQHLLTAQAVRIHATNTTVVLLNE
jgi:hypothetical protein